MKKNYVGIKYVLSKCESVLQQAQKRVCFAAFTQRVLELHGGKKNEGKKIERQRYDGGFTFVETLAVIAVTAVLASGTFVSASRLVSMARRTAARTQIEQYRSALQTYFLDCGQFPTGEQGLEALWQKPVLYPVPENWNGPYIDRAISKDPWGCAYIYFAGRAALPVGTPEGLPFVIVSYGADRTSGGEGNDEDIISWQQ